MPRATPRPIGPILKAVGIIGLLLAAYGAARAAPPDEARALYDRFVQAQNAHDYAAVKDTLLDGPDFLWVTDGRRVWGRDAAVARMASYHANDVWRITPDAARVVAVPVNDRAAYLSVPLLLEIGGKDAPDRLRFLVNALCRETGHGWKIAALFTTLENPANTD